MSKGELNIIVSSDPTQGAFNVSPDGSYFEIKLEDGGIQIPKDATQCYLSCEEATVWWTVPNVITGVNDHVYIRGPSAVEIVTDINLGIPNSVSSASAGTLTIVGTMPLALFQVGDVIKFANGAEYPITVVGVYTTGGVSFTTSNTTTLASSNQHWYRERSGTGVTNYMVVLPQGLYDLNAMQNAIATQLENLGASSATEPIISLSADTASQRVNIRFPFPTSAVDFSQPETIRTIIGFPPTLIGDFVDAPKTITGSSTPAFNAVNYFLLHTDLTNLGLRFNNQYSQVVSQILIDRPPGSQILSRPFNPARIPVPELIGATRNSIRVWLTNDQNERINTNGEYYSARLKLEYY